MQENTQLVELLKPYDLEEIQNKPIIDSFGALFVEAHKLAVQSKGIKVTDESQVAEMQQARELRLKLQKVRTDADKIRATLKEGYLRGANGIQAIFNDIKKTTEPEEEYLKQQEKFAEIKQMERLHKRYEDRVTKLSKYVEDLSIYNLNEMADAVFERVLASSEEMYEKKIADEAKAEEERLKAEKVEKLRQERFRIIAPYLNFYPKKYEGIDKGLMTDEEFETLLKEAKQAKKEHDDQQAAIQAENERLKKEAQEKERLAAIEKQKQDEALAKERKAQEDKIAAANKLAADAEKKLREQKEAQLEKDRKEKEAIEAQKRADEEVKRKALLAPDKQKLTMLAGDLSLFQLPVVQSREAGEIMTAVSKKLSEIVVLLQEGARKL